MEGGEGKSERVWVKCETAAPWVLGLGREWQPCPLYCAGSLGKVHLNPELQGQQELPWVFGWPWWALSPGGPGHTGREVLATETSS